MTRGRKSGRYALKVAGPAMDLGPSTHVHDGRYIHAFDVDAHDGIGRIVSTEKVSQALTWASATDALRAWRTQSRVRPLRDDGKPNRPLTAYTMEVVLLP